LNDKYLELPLKVRRVGRECIQRGPISMLEAGYPMLLNPTIVTTTKVLQHLANTGESPVDASLCLATDHVKIIRSAAGERFLGVFEVVQVHQQSIADPLQGDDVCDLVRIVIVEDEVVLRLVAGIVQPVENHAQALLPQLDVAVALDYLHAPISDLEVERAVSQRIADNSGGGRSGAWEAFKFFHDMGNVWTCLLERDTTRLIRERSEAIHALFARAAAGAIEAVVEPFLSLNRTLVRVLRKGLDLEE
jgi:hypothetical protein